MSSAIDRLKNLTNKISSYELARKENLKRLRELFDELSLDEKVNSFEDIFRFKAINLSGVSLQSDTLGEIKEGKYLQLLAISYDKKAKVKSKNISLGYFGRVENVDKIFLDKVIEFVIRYRFEKSFMTLQNYYDMLEKIK